MKSSRSGVNRRDLLRLRPHDGSAALRDDRTHAKAGASDLIKAHRAAMGSFFEVRLPAGTPGAVDLACRALDVIERLEGQMTVYHEDSEVSRLNRLAHEGPVEVEKGLFTLIAEAVALSRETDGAYDVSAGALSEAWGFVKGPRRRPDEQTLADARARTGWQHLKLDRERLTIAFDCEGLRINLGSIGKGFAIDRAADVIRAHWWPAPALIHGGQSSLYALGSPPGKVGGRWEIALRNPFSPETPLGTLRLRNRGLGTSGAAFQKFVVDGRIYGHLIDPRTGEPALGPASVTVLAPTAALADALSTAFYLLGPDAAGGYLAKHPEIGAVFVEEGHSPESPRLIVLGLSEYDFAAEEIAVN